MFVNFRSESLLIVKFWLLVFLWEHDICIILFIDFLLLQYKNDIKIVEINTVAWNIYHNKRIYNIHILLWMYTYT